MLNPNLCHPREGGDPWPEMAFAPAPSVALIVLNTDSRFRGNDNGGVKGKGLTTSPTYYVYIMASQKNGTIYIGVTNDIILRSMNHREGKGGIFTKRNRVQRLVYYEQYADVRDAIVREKQLKKWNRQWKINLIEKGNPEWRDLWFDLNR